MKSVAYYIIIINAKFVSRIAYRVSRKKKLEKKEDRKKVPNLPTFNFF